MLFVSKKLMSALSISQLTIFEIFRPQTFHLNFPRKSALVLVFLLAVGGISDVCQNNFEKCVKAIDNAPA